MKFTVSDMQEYGYYTRNINDGYNLDYLLRLCEDESVVAVDTDTNHETIPIVLAGVYYFIRTFNGNLVVQNDKTRKCLFRIQDHPDFVGMTLNDYILVALGSEMKKLFIDSKAGNDSKTLALNSAPTPFGVMRLSNDCYVAVFQMVYENKMLDLPEGYSLVSIDDAIGGYQMSRIKKQFKRTKE